jgi:hypothetical protein
MKELQGMIIGSIVGENQYKKVSFLEAEDFTNYPDKPYRDYYKLIQKSECKPDVFLSLLQQCKNRNIQLMDEVLVLSAYHNLHKYALYLLEIRFKSTLSSLLVNLSLDSKNVLESSLLDEINSGIIKEDIFVVGDNILDYLGRQASSNTTNRINSYISWRNKRIKLTKTIIG